MKLLIHPKLVFRSPRFSVEDSLPECWKELKEAIAESSDDFYQLIKDLEPEDLPDQAPAVRNTVWKYFNRARHRSTPFGRFAAVGVCDAAYSRQNGPITVSAMPEYHRFVDWTLKNEAEYTFEQLVQADGLLFANSTYYPFQNSIRYITFHDEKFEIAEMEPDAFVLCVLELCRHPLPVTVALSRLRELHPEIEDVQEHIISLISLQLLFTSLDPNITGEDYFRRIGLKCEQAQRHYVISERKCLGGHFDLRLLKRLDGLIALLRQLIPQNENAQLRDFIQRFGNRFDRREVPLMTALDPELGVGYGLMEASSGIDGLVLQLAANKVQDKADGNLLKEILTKELFGKPCTKHKHIQLDALDIKTGMDTVPPLPNTFNGLFSVADDTICMEHMGGLSATSLAGRFTLAVDDIHRFANEMAKLEQEANPDVLFFDLAYMAETTVDNVNRRRQVYDYQLALLNYDTSASPITADDILILLQGNEPVLRSKSLNKRLVPRLASAYNHVRSDLPLFRLLCDLQQYGLQFNLSLRPEQLFPDMDHYPRISYHNIMLAPEKWRIDRKEASAYIKQAPGPSSLKDYLQHRQVSRHIRCGVADQTLYFDLESTGDMDALRHYLHRRESLLLEEVLMAAAPLVKDEKGKAYAAQFMVTITHQDRLYSAMGNNTDRMPDKGTANRFFLPGNEWLYTEIHCHPHRMDSLLGGKIHIYLRQHEKSITQWFFIRYDEGGSPHIRLRLKLHDASDGHLLMESLSAYLNSEYRDGTVSDIRIRAYNRELERYGRDLMDEVETCFYRDSRYILSVIQSGYPEYHRYALCIALMCRIKERHIAGLDHFGQVVNKVLQSLQTEHRTGAKDFALLNLKYREYRNAAGNFEIPDQLVELTESFVYVLGKCPQLRRATLLADLFHMHVNRMFAEHQRTHEMVIYYFLEKKLKSEVYGAV